MTEDLQPLPDGYKQALARARVVTPNLAHTLAWAWTAEEEVAKMLGGGTRYRRSQDPDVYEWECTVTHPDGVALCVELCESQRG